MTLARTLFVLALTIWIGSVAFFSLGVLPILFTRLGPPRAGEVVALLFPVYYRVGVAFGVLLLAASAYLAGRVRGAWRYAAALALVMVACQAYAAFSVHPRVAMLRGVEAERPRFDALHRRSVRLNGVVLGGGLVLVLSSGYLLGKR
jgi:hypothetical protein